MAAVIRIQVATLSDVADGESRNDGVPSQLVTVTAVGSYTTATLRFWDIYPAVANAAALPTLTVASPGVWTWTPGATYGQSFGLELIYDSGLATETTSRRRYSIRTQQSLLPVPLFGESADPSGSYYNDGATIISRSTDNFDDNWRGWGPPLQSLVTQFEALLVASKSGDWKDSVHSATTAALAPVTATATTLTEVGNGALAAQDGVTLTAGQYLLVKNQAAPAQNGIYTVTVVGTAGTQFVLTRRSDSDTTGDLTAGVRVPVIDGATVSGGKLYRLSVADPITIGTTAQTWTIDGTIIDYGEVGDIYSVFHVADAGVSTEIAAADHRHARFPATGQFTGGPSTNSVGSTDHTIFVSATTGDITIGLPVGAAGYEFVFVHRAGLFNIVLDPNGAQTIEGGGTFTVMPTQAVNVRWDDLATTWKVTSNKLTVSATSPAAVGTATAGVAGDVSASDHAHAHGNQLGGALHANADGSTAGFMTAAQFNKLAALGYPHQENMTTENITGTDTALGDTLNATPIANACLMLFLNGVFQRQGAGFDYTVSSATITWLASSGTAVDMTTGDWLVAFYLATS